MVFCEIIHFFIFIKSISFFPKVQKISVIIVKKLQGTLMSLITSPLSLLSTKDVETNPETFGNEHAGEKINEDWQFGVFVEPRKENKVGKLASVFIATNIVHGSFVFEFDPKSGLKGGRIINKEDAERLNEKAISELAKGFIRYNGIKDKSLEGILNEQISLIESSIKDDAEFLSGMSIIPTEADGSDILDVYAYFLKNNINIQQEIEKVQSKYSSFLTQMSKAIEQHKKGGATKKKEPSGRVLPKGRIGDTDYRKKIEEEVRAANRAIDGFFRNIAFDSKNKAQVRIAREMIKGNDVMLMGETGIGKTHNPKDISTKNNIVCFQINLDADTESAELIGKPNFGKNLFTGEQEVGYDDGKLVMALKKAHSEAKEGRGIILILDEILRMNDMTPFISNLSVISDREYCVTTDRNIDFAKISTLNQGDVWMMVSEEIDRYLQRYTISGEGEVEISDKSEFLCYDGGKENAAERGFRGDLLKISILDFKELAQKNPQSIMQTYRTKDTIYAPQRSMSIVGTSNIGADYEVNMNMDNALFGRMKPVPVERPTISYMIRASINSPEFYSNWSKEELKKVQKIFTDFFTVMDKKIKNELNIDVGQKVNFRIIKSALNGISKDKPLTDPLFSVYDVLKDTAIEFAPIDPSVSADKIKDHRIVVDAINAIDILKNGEETIHTRSAGGNSWDNQADMAVGAGIARP